MASNHAGGPNLAAPPKRTLPPDLGEDGERRQATVLFADVAGFTAFSEQFGEEAAYRLMQRLSAFMTEAVHEQGGTIKNFTGDGVMALFGVPLAVEDAPLRACRAALAIHNKIAEAAPEFECSYGRRPEVRIGINTGAAVIGTVQSGESTGITALGDAVNFAARLQALADPGATLLSETAYHLVAGLVESHPAGDHSVKGKAERQRVYRLIGIREGATRFDAAITRGLTTYIGRNRELETLERCFSEMSTGLRVIDIAGEAGIGKSRLLHEFRNRLADKRALILSGSCSPTGQQTPFLPFIEVVRGSFRLAVGEDQSEMVRKLNKGLSLLGLDSTENLALLLNLLGLPVPDRALQGLDGILIGLRTRDLLLMLLKERCRVTPVVLLVEDLHWIDTVSEELLARVVTEGIAALLVVCTRRPEYSPPWRDDAKITKLELQPLSLAETSQIVQCRLKVANLPGTLASLIVDRVEGNPFFAEEVASYLLERRLVRQTPDGIQYDAGAVAAALPESIQSLLTARIDRLTTEDRGILQAAAVIGRRFSADLLATVTELPNLPERLTAMEMLDLVHGDSRSDGLSFKHALVQDALYNGLLSSVRCNLHLTVAEEIERRSGNRLSEVAEALAQHYDRAGAAAKAFRYNAMAGNKSLGTYSVDEAEKYLRRALEIAESQLGCVSEQDIAEVVERLSYLLTLETRSVPLCDLMDRYLARIEAVGDSASLVATLHHYSWTLSSRTMFKKGYDIACRALEIANRLDNIRARAYARSAVILSSIFTAPMPIDTLIREAETLLKEAAQEPDGYIEYWARMIISWDYMHRGLTSDARMLAEQIISLGRGRNNPRALGLGLWCLGWFDIIEERYGDALQHADEGIGAALSTWDRVVNTQVKGIALIMLGQLTRGVELLLEIRQECVANDWVYNLTGTDLILTLATVLQGKFGKGVREIERYIAAKDVQEYRVAADWGRLYLAEVYIELLSGKQKPSFVVLLRNVMFLFRALPFAAKRGLRLLERASANAQFSPSGIFAARINMDIGLLHKLNKRFDLALAHLEKAREIAMSLGETTISSKIDIALADMH